MVVKLLEEPGFPATCRVKSEGVKIVAKRLEEPGFPPTIYIERRMA